MSSRRKQGSKVLYKYNKWRYNNVNSQFNSSETDNSNTPSINNLIGNYNLPCINVHAKSLINKLINLKQN